MKPQPIRNILKKITLSRLAVLADQAYREGIANERLRRMEAERARKIEQQKLFERQEIRRIRRPEFLFLKNAIHKEERYQKHLEFERWEQDRIAAMRLLRPLKYMQEETDNAKK